MRESTKNSDIEWLLVSAFIFIMHYDHHVVPFLFLLSPCRSRRKAYRRSVGIQGVGWVVLSVVAVAPSITHSGYDSVRANE